MNPLTADFRSGIPETNGTYMSGWNVEKVDSETLTGELYVPDNTLGKDTARKRPAMVIMPSSAGVCDIRERFYAGKLAEQGCLCLIADIFARRGLTQCMTDQTLLSDRDMLEDAWTAQAWLAARDDTDRIGILGVSKGGLAALNAAMSPMPGMAAAEGSFAIHICIAPSCAVQLRCPRTTGAPILILLGGSDDYTGAAPAMDYAGRIANAGSGIVETVVFPGAHHGWELCGKPQYYPQAECYADCLLYLEEDGTITNDATGENMTAEAFRERRRSFARYGAHAGGGTGALRRKGCETILDFMRRTGFLPRQT